MTEAVTPAPRTCRSCPNTISPKSRTGRCAPCAWADPDVRARKGKLTLEQRARRAEHARSLSADPAIVARRTAASRAALAQPGANARFRKACQVAKARLIARDPTYIDRMREAGRTTGAGNLHRANMPDARLRAAATLSAKMRAWCPAHLWPLNVMLKRNGYLLAERKVMIAQEVEREAQRAVAAEAARVAALSPLDRQLERLRGGARLIAKPVLRRADPAFTLGGVAPEAV